jgi:hypothetical protein
VRYWLKIEFPLAELNRNSCACRSKVRLDRGPQRSRFWIAGVVDRGPQRSRFWIAGVVDRILLFGPPSVVSRRRLFSPEPKIAQTNPIFLVMIIPWRLSMFYETRPHIDRRCDCQHSRSSDAPDRRVSRRTTLSQKPLKDGRPQHGGVGTKQAQDPVLESTDALARSSRSPSWAWGCRHW